MLWQYLQAIFVFIATLCAQVLQLLNFSKRKRMTNESSGNGEFAELQRNHKQIQKIIAVALSQDENVQPLLQVYRSQDDAADAELHRVISDAESAAAEYRKGLALLQVLAGKLRAQNSSANSRELHAKVQRELNSVNERINSLCADVTILRSKASSGSQTRRRAVESNNGGKEPKPAEAPQAGASSRSSWLDPSALISWLSFRDADAPQSTSASPSPSAPVATPASSAKVAPTSRPAASTSAAKPMAKVDATPRPKLPPQRPANTSVGSNSKNVRTTASAKPVNTNAQSSAQTNVEEQYLRAIRSELVQPTGGLKLEDVVGSDEAKQALVEAVILPLRRPDLFNGLRVPARGILLFGPPGNGKTLLARAIANEAGAALLSVSAATLMSKWVGDGEKMARALFAVARERQPAIIFIDEVDSILRERSDADAEASRRLKTQLLVELDGATAKLNSESQNADAVIVLAATNRPAELDTAALRRFPRRIYMRMPDRAARESLLRTLLARGEHKHSLGDSQIRKLADLTDGYSNSDLTALARDAALAPLRSLNPEELLQVRVEQLRPITLQDFNESLKQVRRSVPLDQIESFDKWNKLYGGNNT